ncbi:MAG: amidase [Holophagaceae bacterium]|nr:amidase [Holophagaceae bacterium]
MAIPSEQGLDRRDFLNLGLAAGAFTVAAPLLSGTSGKSAPKLEELSLADLQAGLASGRWTSKSLVAGYLARIRSLDQSGPSLRSVIEVNPEALAIAAALDRERKEKGPRGPLHGIPVLIKDNIDTADKMRTTAGSLALMDAPAPKADAFVVQKLREAGAVILGKTNLSEWANFRGKGSTSGWSGRGGLTRNPYALDRNPSGSSSGSAVAVAASLCAAAVGTETDGSIVSPSNACGIVGLKPTLGLVSRSGIIPIAHSQDTAGPMARTVRDVAMLLGAMAGLDPKDSATEAARGKAVEDYTRLLDPDGLKGARLGVVRSFMGSNPHLAKAFAAALEAIKAAGAELIDPIGLSTSGYDDAEFDVLLYEFKADLNAYLTARGGAVKDLTTLIAFNEAKADRELLYFGQQILQQANAKGPLADPAYVKALETCRRLSQAGGIDAAMDKHRLDALLAPTGNPADVTDLVNGGGGGGSCSSPAAVAGYPHLTVPMGHAFGLPVGLSFFGRAWSERKLLNLGFAFEQATKARRPPGFQSTVML